ncbi:MAG: zinc ribbon domain-containing protein [Bacteroidales bacterium]
MNYIYSFVKKVPIEHLHKDYVAILKKLIQNFHIDHTNKLVTIIGTIEILDSKTSLIITIDKSDETIRITAKYDFHIFFYTIIILCLITAFITVLSIIKYIIAIFIIITIVYLFFRVILYNNFQKIVYSLLYDNEQISLYEKQKRWIQSPDKCPACGESVSLYDSICLSCELKLRHKPTFSRFTTTMPINNLNYKYIKKQRNESRDKKTKQ